MLIFFLYYIINDSFSLKVNRIFFAVPLSGPGGRIGVFPVSKAGRLPVKIPAVVCGAEVTDFKFDPFDPTILVTCGF